MVTKLKLPVVEHGKPLTVALGASTQCTLPRRTTKFQVSIEGFEPYESEAFIMPIPEGRDVLLGMPWLRFANPDIDWASLSIRPRASSQSMRFAQCSMPKHSISASAMLHYLRECPIHLQSGATRVVSVDDFADMLAEGDTEYCFFVDATLKQTPTTWDSLHGHPLEAILLRYKDTVFRDTLPQHLPQRKIDVTTEVDLTDDTPVAGKQFRVSPEMREAIRQWTRDMEAANIIRPSKSPYCAPTFCVRKKDGWRIVHDFRGINTKIRVPATPIPRKEDIFDAMSGAWYFSCMDLLWGFYQVRMREQDIPFTAFATPDGLYEYLVTPMGLSCSPAAFNRLMQTVFKDLQQFCQAYFDDLFVFTSSHDVTDHAVAVDAVLQRCLENELYIKLAKCVFASHEIPCLGDFIGRDGIRIDPKKTALIHDWPVPKNKQQMQSFLGTCNYVAKFCAGFAELIAPLVTTTVGLAAKDRVQLNDEQLECFATLKERLSTAPILAHPDHSRAFHMRMDACNYAVGGYLFQVDVTGKESIIAFGGRKLSKAELAYTTREKELLAALHGMRIWKPYLLDKPFYVSTDHRTIESLLTQSTCSQRLARWLNELALFKPLFKWIPGDTNSIADAVSRHPSFEPTEGSGVVSLADLLSAIATGDAEHDHAALLHVTELTTSSLLDQCRALYAADDYFGPLALALAAPESALTSASRCFCLQEGIIYFQVTRDAPPRVCVPDDPTLRDRILFEAHDSPTSGHPGRNRTLAAVSAKFFWPKMAQHVTKYVASCEMCQRTKSARERPLGLLNPLDIPANRWQDISMDFMTKLPRSTTGYDAIMVIVDRLTKRAHFLATTTKATAQSTACLFRDRYQPLHGLPLSIVSDRDVKFTSAFWRHLMAAQGTQLKLSSAFRPNTDGQSERLNQFIIAYLRVFIDPRQDDWDQHLGLAEFAYNSRFHASLGMTPFEADLGYIPRSALDLVLGTSIKAEPMKFLEHQQLILQSCHDSIHAAQVSMKYYYDRHRRTTTFTVGDYVLLDTSYLDPRHIGTTGVRKFAPQYIGPYQVLAATTPDTYKLALPPGLRLHDEFHVSRLRRYIEDTTPGRVNRVPRLITKDGDDGHQVKSILGQRKRQGRQQYLVQWFDSSIEPSWEPASALGQVQGLIDQFLAHQHRRGKDSSEGGTVRASCASATRNRTGSG